jgi:hypothetical protein
MLAGHVSEEWIWRPDEERFLRMSRRYARCAVSNEEDAVAVFIRAL